MNARYNMMRLGLNTRQLALHDYHRSVVMLAGTGEKECVDCKYLELIPIVVCRIHVIVK